MERERGEALALRGVTIVRAALILVAVLFAPLVAAAQPAGKIARLGYLSPLAAAADAPRREAFVQGLRDLGYVDGRNVAIEWRFADGKLERLSDLAAELVRQKVDVIVAGGGGQIALAARKVTSTI